MSTVYPYISTSQTADPYLPATAQNITILARDTSDAIYALQGGYRTVGKLAFFPVQRAVAGHLLCDGSEIPKAGFPELFAYLGDTQGTPVDPANFVLPNYIGAALTGAATATAETVVGGTVTSGTATPGGGDSGGSVGGAVDSGGRPRRAGVEEY